MKHNFSAFGLNGRDPWTFVMRQSLPVVGFRGLGFRVLGFRVTVRVWESLGFIEPGAMELAFKCLPSVLKL